MSSLTSDLLRDPHPPHVPSLASVHSKTTSDPRGPVRRRESQIFRRPFLRSQVERLADQGAAVRGRYLASSALPWTVVSRIRVFDPSFLADLQLYCITA